MSKWWWCSGTKKNKQPCNYRVQSIVEPNFPKKCIICGADPIKWVVKEAATPQPVTTGNVCTKCGLTEEKDSPFHFCLPVRILPGTVERRDSDTYKKLYQTIMSCAETQKGSGSRPELVQKQLHTLIDLHRWAVWVVEEAKLYLRSANVSMKRSTFTEIEHTLRRHFTRGDSLIPLKEFGKFSINPPEFRKRLQAGWDILVALWPKLSVDEQVILVTDVQRGLNHEKGYHHTFTDISEKAALKGISLE